MNLALFGCNYRTAPVELRERLAVSDDRLPAALAELLARFGGEAVLLATCNRMELYLADSSATRATVAAHLAAWACLDATALDPLLYERRDSACVRHMFRVAASLDSMVVGEGQIAGQVKRAYESAQNCAAVGPTLHALCQHARIVAKRVRRETGIAQGHASVSSLAVDFVRQVFARFDDKTVLIIGAGKMGRLTLRHLHSLGVGRILVTNRSADKAAETANECGGHAILWEQLDAALTEADIVLSTTGAAEPVMTAARFAGVLARREGGPLVILDIAVPRDFDPAIHDGDQVCLFNIDDLQKIREETLAARSKHIPPAEAIVEHEARRFESEWSRRRTAPVIARLTADFDEKRRAILAQLMPKLNGKLTDAERQSIEGAFRLLQNQFLHGPISALGEAGKTDDRGSTLMDAIRHLFRLKD